MQCCFKWAALGVVLLYWLVSPAGAADPRDERPSAPPASGPRDVKGEKSSSPPPDKGQPHKPAKGLGKASGGKTKGDGFTPEREATAMTFVRQHHPELMEVLDQLKKRHSPEYRKAVQDLFRISEKLAQVRERDLGRYENELEAWKIKSRIQLLAVRLRMNPDDAAVRAELKGAITRQIELNQQRLQDERQRVADRLQKIDEQLARSDGNRDSRVKERIEQLLRPKAPRNDVLRIKAEAGVE